MGKKNRDANAFILRCKPNRFLSQTHAICDRNTYKLHRKINFTGLQKQKWLNMALSGYNWCKMVYFGNKS